MSCINIAKRQNNNLNSFPKSPFLTRRNTHQNVYWKTSSTLTLINKMGRRLRCTCGHVFMLFKDLLYGYFSLWIMHLVLAKPVEAKKKEGEEITYHEKDINSTSFSNKTNDCTSGLTAEYNGYSIRCNGFSSIFWLAFKPPSRMVFFTFAIVYILISTIGIIGNFFVIFMFVRCKSLRTPANILVLNLAICDFLMLLKCPIAIYNNFMEGPALGDQACQCYGFVGGLSGTAAIGTLTAIAVERYQVVVHPLNHVNKTSLLRPSFTIIGIWIYSVCFSIVPALNIGLSVYVPEGFMTTCSFDYLDRSLNAQIFMFTFFVAAWLIPFITIIFCYCNILRVVLAARNIQSNRRNNDTEHKITIIIFTIIIIWFCSWTPYTVVALMGIFGYEGYLTPMASMLPAIFCKVAACIDPYLYAASHPRFRKELHRFLHGENPLQRETTMFVSCTTTSRRHTEHERRQRSCDAFMNVLPTVQEATDEFHDSRVSSGAAEAIEFDGSIKI